MTGRIESGTVKVGDEIEVVGLATGQAPRRSVVTGVEMFHRSMSQAQAGDNVGLLLRGIKKGDVERGQVRIPRSMWTAFSSASACAGMLNAAVLCCRVLTLVSILYVDICPCCSCACVQGQSCSLKGGVRSQEINPRACKSTSKLDRGMALCMLCEEQQWLSDTFRLSPRYHVPAGALQARQHARMRPI